MDLSSQLLRKRNGRDERKPSRLHFVNGNDDNKSDKYDKSDKSIIKEQIGKIVPYMKFKSEIIHYKNKLERKMPIRSELRLGGVKYISFIIIDLICLIAANFIPSSVYLTRFGINYIDHVTVLVVACLVDVIVTFTLNTLSRVLRRSSARELYECIKHIIACFVTLSLILFITKSGAEYSRVVIILTYAINFVFIFLFRNLWKRVMVSRRQDTITTALVMTADSFAEEAVEALKKKNVVVKDVYLLKTRGKAEINGIPVVSTAEDAATAICWEQIDKVYIYGLDDQTVPDVFIDMCLGMGVRVDLVDFSFRVVDLKTIQAPAEGYGSLTFLEGKRDIPFPIRRVYWITETNANLHRGFHAHKLNCQLLFCPHGSIDILLDDGEKKDTVRLDDPGKGLILMPGLWREMVWNQSGSVLCVLASEYYDPAEYIRDYDEFLKYSRQYQGNA